MNPFNKTPHVQYICLWRRRPSTKPRKGHKKLAFSDRYRFEGYVEIEDLRYRLIFTTYADIAGLMDGSLGSKPTMVDLYCSYVDGIMQAERQLFSPVLAQGEGRLGVPGIIEKGGCRWQPYAVMSVTDTKDGKGGQSTDIDVDFYAVELDTCAVVKLTSLTCEPGQITCYRGQKRRWVWHEYGRDRDAAPMAA